MARRVSLYPDSRYTCRVEQRGDGRWEWSATFDDLLCSIDRGVARTKARASRRAEKACWRHMRKRPLPDAPTSATWHPLL